jgi:uncharacterized membrane protein (UPF0127 family)
VDVLRAFVVFVAMIASSICSPAQAPSSLEKVQVTVTRGAVARVLTVEVAATAADRARGLMYRVWMAEDAGMLFLFPRDTRQGFWMRNTFIPLDIAYIGADGTVQEIRNGVPLSEAVLTPAQPYRYVLEVNAGWFERHGMGAGAKVALPPGLPVPR